MAFEEVRPHPSVGNTLGLALAGSIGVAAALVADFFQKGQSSAVYQLEIYLSSYFGLEVPFYVIALGLVVTGAAAVFVNEPVSKRAAFTTGASILAILMTLMPVREQDLLPADPTILEGEAEDPAILDEPLEDASINVLSADGVQQASLTLRMPAPRAEPALVQVQNAEIPVEIVVTLPGARKGDIDLSSVLVVLYDSVSRSTYRLGSPVDITDGAGGLELIYAARVPVRGSRTTARGVVLADLSVRVEAPGYRISFAETEVTDQSAVTRLSVSLPASTTPLWMQRLNTPRKF
ncbi:MAG: hypothetical protein HXY25_03825 [Alphaproteobacteria bacterium]|nr:hypothetical protein [Alphaproteobacteria bacterium]